MARQKLLVTGLVGSGVTALCCFTPVLGILLGGLGLTAWLGWLDLVLLPALALFLAMTLAALFLRRTT